MKAYGFLLAHGYEIWKGYLEATSEKDATQKILNHEWSDIIDEYETSIFVEGYEIVEIWEAK